MYCASCGKELKDGDRFCSACGAPATGSGGPATGSGEPAAGSGEPARAFGAAVSENGARGSLDAAEADGGQLRKKPSPLMIAVLALVLVAVVALVAVLVTQQAARNEQVAGQVSQAGSPTSGASSEASPVLASGASSEASSALTEEERAIASLDGWWESVHHENGYRAAFGNVHDGVIDWYNSNDAGTEVAYSSTARITKAERFAENGAEGWRFFTDTSPDESWAYYEVDGNENELPIYKVAFGYGVVDQENYNIYSVERYGMARIADDSPAGSSALFAQAQALAEERSAQSAAAQSGDGAQGGAESSGQAKDDGADGFDQAKAEAEARASAEAAGKTVLEGTVFIGMEGDWAQMEGLQRAPNPGSSFTYVGLILDEPATVSARNADGGTVREKPYVERSGVYVLLGSDYNSDVVDRWAPYDGQRASVAFSDFESFSDSLGVLFAFRGSGERIAPLAESDAAAAAAVSASGGDFVLADSSTRSYSRSELEALDNHSLFLARNEIFARHGCGFRTPELRDRFGSMSWYSEDIPAGTYGTEMLNDVERSNVELMKAIETERNSPYL